MSKLTDRAVGALPANDSDAVYWDGELTGFGVRVRVSGRKTWVLQTRVRGRLRWFTLGHYGAPGIENLGAEAARAQARQLLALAKRGIDPREGPDKDRAPSPSVAALGQRFLEDYVPDHCKPGTQAHYRRMVEKFIVPALGDMPAGDVQRKDAA
ncbi:MAG: integrase arm-type DNA-binding domain-containing protein, partial [Rhodospirillaceae bacterium]|nr:integrase arm-type DNA-binding domain-containing protein [Rhodospirillaceae bacterium]